MGRINELLCQALRRAAGRSLFLIFCLVDIIEKVDHRSLCHFLLGMNTMATAATNLQRVHAGSLRCASVGRSCTALGRGQSAKTSESTVRLGLARSLAVRARQAALHYDFIRARFRRTTPD